MPAGPVNYTTPSSSNVGGLDETVNFYGRSINPGYLVPGINVLAAEVHQSSAASTDLSFDFDLKGVQSYIAPFITTQPQSQTIFSGTSVQFGVTAQGTAPLRYQWRFNGTNLIGATNAVLPRPVVSSADAGNYHVVISNSIGSATSQIAALTVIMSDSDGDGMPDWWENVHNLDPNNSADALGDADADGMSNRDEFIAGTNPRDADSVLRIQILNANGITLRFPAQSNIAYNVEFQTNLMAAWQILRNVSPQSSNRMVDVSDPGASNSPACLYRIASPR